MANLVGRLDSGELSTESGFSVLSGRTLTRVVCLFSRIYFSCII